MRFLIIACLIGLIISSSAQAEIINVPADFETIQAGIDAAEEADTVLVQEGRYNENVDFRGKEIVVTSRYLITREQVYVVATVIDGGANTSVVSFTTWESENSALIGFTIQNSGNENGVNQDEAGIYCIDSRPSIRNCIITSNNQYGIYCINANPVIDSCEVSENSSFGILCTENSNPIISNSTISENNNSGIRCNSSDPTIMNCRISGNSITHNNQANGGGIYCFSSSPVIINCFIIGNSVNGHGGGISCHRNSSPSLSRCSINQNEAGSQGGGVYITEESDPSFDICEIKENSATEGGGIYCIQSNDLVIKNSNIFGNTSSQAGGAIFGCGSNLSIVNCTISMNMSENHGGGGLFSSGRSNSTVTNTIFWDNRPQELFFNEEYEASLVSLSFSNLAGGRDAVVLNNNGRVAWGEGNINSDPLFANAGGGDFNLNANSPCIDTGDPDSPLDPDSTRADMGAFYFPQQSIGIDQEALNFGHVEFGQVDSLELIIQNYGKRPLTINSQAITQDEPAFFVGSGGGEVVIEPESTHSTWVLFSPPDMDQYLGSIEIESDDPDEPIIQVALQGESELSVNPNEIDLPGRFELCEVYPNPFNAITTVSYSLPIPSPVSIQICDLSGRLIETLVNDLQPAGQHSTTWNGRNASSGVYLVRMETSEFSDVRKVVLVR